MAQYQALLSQERLFVGSDAARTDIRLRQSRRARDNPGVHPLMSNARLYQRWLETLYSLRRDKRGQHERPHKPALILSVLDLLDRGLLRENHIELSPDLVTTFRRYMEVLRQADDRPNIEYPFYHLSGDGFWHLVSPAGQPPLYQQGQTTGPLSVAGFRRLCVHARLDDELWGILADPLGRRQIRDALIGRYFPTLRDRLASLAASPVLDLSPMQEDLIPGRDAAFRRVVLEIYDHRCSACGIQVRLDEDLTLVEAAHLIPFAQSRNDNPTNGLALCPNHHWAMDRHLIAPCPDAAHRAGVWRARGSLDRRIQGQRELLELDGQRVIPPGEQMFLPALDSLRWRENQLAGAPELPSTGLAMGLFPKARQ